MTHSSRLSQSLQREYEHNFRAAFAECVAGGCEDVEEATRRARSSAEAKLAQVLQELNEGQDG